MFKKVVSLLLVFVFVFSTCINAQATEIHTENQILSTTDITNLQEIAEQETPEGYILEDVDMEIVYFDSSAMSDDAELPIEPRGIIYELRNVVHTDFEFMYTNDYESDYFYGPCTVSETYTKSTKATVNASTDIGKSTLSAGLGFSFTKEFTVSKTYSTSVAADKYLHLKIYVVYRQSTFDIYNKWTGEKVESSWAGKPVGICVLQYTYSK